MQEWATDKHPKSFVKWILESSLDIDLLRKESRVFGPDLAGVNEQSQEFILGRWQRACVCVLHGERWLHRAGLSSSDSFLGAGSLEPIYHQDLDEQPKENRLLFIFSPLFPCSFMFLCSILITVKQKNSELNKSERETGKGLNETS